MNQFSTAFFGGYRKDQVDEYINSMIAQIEQMKKRTEEVETNEKDMQGKLTTLQEQFETMKNEYTGKIEALEEELKEKRLEAEERAGKISQLEEKLHSQQDSYDSVSRVLLLAEKEAEEIKIRAQQEALVYRRKAESDITAKNEEKQKELAFAHHQILRYLESLNMTKDKLMDTYNELGNLVKNMPLHMEDLMSKHSSGLEESKVMTISEEQEGEREIRVLGTARKDMDSSGISFRRLG